MTLKCNLSQPGLLFVFNAKKASLNSFPLKDYYRVEIVVFGRYDSKFALFDGILVANLYPMFLNYCYNGFLASNFHI